MAREVLRVFEEGGAQPFPGATGLVEEVMEKLAGHRDTLTGIFEDLAEMSAQAADIPASVSPEDVERLIARTEARLA